MAQPFALHRIEAAARSCIDFTRARTGAVLPRGLAHFVLGYTADEAPAIVTDDPHVALWERRVAAKAATVGEESDEPYDRLVAVDNEIADTPADTPFGVLVKLRILAEIHADDFLDADISGQEPHTTDARLIRGAMADLERLGPVPASTISNADADLLDLGEKWSKHLAEMESGVHTMGGNVADEATERDDTMRRQIVTMPAHTIGGVLLKLRVAQEEPENDVLEPVIPAILSDTLDTEIIQATSASNIHLVDETFHERSANSGSAGDDDWVCGVNRCRQLGTGWVDCSRVVSE